MDRCVVCGSSQTDLHHIKTRGSGGRDEDFNTVRLCRTHHTAAHRLGYVRFCELHPIFLTTLSIKGWVFADEFGVRKLRRA